MQQFSGGDLLEIVCKHPDLGEFRFQVKSNESFSLDPGGLRGNDDSNMTTGSGLSIRQINRVRWSFEGPLAVDVLSNLEIENLPLLSGALKEGTWTFTMNNGATWKGTGAPVGDLVVDTNTAQLPLKIAGSGILEKL